MFPNTLSITNDLSHKKAQKAHLCPLWLLPDCLDEHASRRVRWWCYPKQRRQCGRDVGGGCWFKVTPGIDAWSHDDRWDVRVV